MIAAPIHTLLESIGNHARVMTEVRKKTHEALGITKGFGPGHPGTSIRGHIVRLTPAIEARFQFRYGIVLTQHTYSGARRIQALVPAVDVTMYLAEGEDPKDFKPLDSEVLIDRSLPWAGQFPPEWTHPVVDTALLSSFTEEWTKSPNPKKHLPKQIEHVYTVPIDSKTLTSIENAIRADLSLP